MEQVQLPLPQMLVLDEEFWSEWFDDPEFYEAWELEQLQWERRRTPE